MVIAMIPEVVLSLGFIGFMIVCCLAGLALCYLVWIDTHNTGKEDKGGNCDD